jgi:hypothetical protein
MAERGMGRDDSADGKPVSYGPRGFQMRGVNSTTSSRFK